jgi:hypothetical protein
MSNELVKDPAIKILLDRREEIRKEVNKLQAEYAAIGELISRDQKAKDKGEER